MKDKQLITNKGVTTYKNVGDTTIVSYHNRYSVSLPVIFRIILIILLLIAIMRVTLGSTQVFTFRAFLNALPTAPSIDVSWLRSFTNWGDSLANIPLIGGSLAFLSKLVSVALFAATGIIQIIFYATWIFSNIF